MIDVRPAGSRLSHQMKTLFRYEGIMVSCDRLFDGLNLERDVENMRRFVRFLDLCQTYWNRKALLIMPEKGLLILPPHLTRQ